MSVNFINPEFRKKLIKLQKKQKLILVLTKLFALIGLIFLLFSFLPSVWFKLTTKVDDFSVSLLETALHEDKSANNKPLANIPDWQPSFKPQYSRETSLKIPSIGVDTIIQEAVVENYESALKKGVWRIPDFGTPAGRSKPMILAAHRFGYLEWSNQYRRKNSFFNLPKLKDKEEVEIIYKQRKYVYEVYGESKGEKITDYSANLILYTCEALNSKIRIFKYARLLQI